MNMLRPCTFTLQLPGGGGWGMHVSWGRCRQGQTGAGVCNRAFSWHPWLHWALGLRAIEAASVRRRLHENCEEGLGPGRLSDATLGVLEMLHFTRFGAVWAADRLTKADGKSHCLEMTSVSNFSGEIALVTENIIAPLCWTTIRCICVVIRNIHLIRPSLAVHYQTAWPNL